VSRVLVVEDDALTAKLLGVLLGQRSHEIVVARDATEAIALLARDRAFAIALVDLNTPGGGGEAVLDAVRTGARLPVVAVTATTDVGTEEKLRARGFDGYVAKPVDPKTFGSVVEKYCAESTTASAAPPSAPAASPLDALRTKYRAKLPALVEDVARAAAEPAPRRAIELAHKLAGLAGSYGFARVTDAARALERALDTDASAPRESLVSALRDALAADLA
jgi:CheY-like chemotaxis protein